MFSTHSSQCVGLFQGSGALWRNFRLPGLLPGVPWHEPLGAGPEALLVTAGGVGMGTSHVGRDPSPEKEHLLPAAPQQEVTLASHELRLSLQWG